MATTVPLGSVWRTARKIVDVSNITFQSPNNNDRGHPPLVQQTLLNLGNIHFVLWVNDCRSLYDRSTEYWTRILKEVLHECACGNAHGSLATTISMRFTYVKQMSRDGWQLHLDYWTKSDIPTLRGYILHEWWWVWKGERVRNFAQDHTMEFSWLTSI